MPRAVLQRFDLRMQLQADEKQQADVERMAAGLDKRSQQFYKTAVKPPLTQSSGQSSVSSSSAVARVSSVSSSSHCSSAQRASGQSAASASASSKPAATAAVKDGSETTKQHIEKAFSVASGGRSSLHAAVAYSSSDEDASEEESESEEHEDDASLSSESESSSGGHVNAVMPQSAILTRCTQLPSPVRIPANDIGLTYLHAFLSADECRELIAYAESTGYERSETTRGVHPNRTSYSSYISRYDSVVAAVRTRVSELTGASRNSIQGPSVVRYMPGQQFTPHYDSDLKLLREYTVFVYLNTLEDGAGGETEFTRLGVKFAPRAGDALFWRNHADRYTNSLLESKHAGRPVLRGVKYGLNIWICFDEL